MNREQYLAALNFCYQVETAGAIAGEVAMLLRENSEEKYKLDLFRRLEASNKQLCAQALQQEGIERPEIATSFYSNGYKLGQKLGKGDWQDFLDRFEATVHPELFDEFVYDKQGNEIQHEYPGVDLPLLKHLVRHEQALVEFIKYERQGRGSNSTTAMENLLADEMCAGLVGAEDPVGW